MKKIVFLFSFVICSVTLFADSRDSSLYVVGINKNKEIKLNLEKKYIFILNDGRKVESKYIIKNDSTLELINHQKINLSEIKEITNEYGQLSKVAFVASGFYFLLTASIVGIVLLIRYFSIKNQNQGGPPNNGEWVLAFLMPFIYTTLTTILSFFIGIILAMMNIKYSSKKYNFIIK